VPPIQKKSVFAPWANATLTFTADNPNGVPVVDEFTGNKSYPKRQITIKCLLNPVRLQSAKSKDNNPGADTTRVQMSGYLVEPFLPGLPEGIEHNAIADCVIEVKDTRGNVIQRKEGKYQISIDLVSPYRVSPITGCPVNGQFFL
jgi:hypothetical protein